MSQFKEIWKPIKNFEGLYEISNHGRVKSLAKSWKMPNGGIYKKGITFLKAGINGHGYYTVSLSNKIIKTKTYKVHVLVWEHFGDTKRNKYIALIDHIDENKLNNLIDNLQLLTNRANMSKSLKLKKTSSKYTGVYFDKKRNKWYTSIYINGKTKYLGRYINEIDAHLAYQKVLKELT